MTDGKGGLLAGLFDGGSELLFFFLLLVILFMPFGYK